MFAELQGAEELGERLGALPGALRAGLQAKARTLAAALAAKVRDEKLSGQALQAVSGALRGSIGAEVTGDGDQTTARVGSFGDVKYAAIQEFGGRTSAHEIVAQKGRALAFLAGGTGRFARSVAHPGSTLAGRGYLSSALDEASGEIVAELTDAVVAAWERS